MMLQKIKLIECPRDAMQGIKTPIPAETKIAYLNLLLKAGFDTIDIGSFVSPKAIPQMADTPEVLENIEWQSSGSKLLVIVANKKGIDDALKYRQVTYLGFPLSVSETFQRRNTNSGIHEALLIVQYLKQECSRAGKIPVVYLSMGFGNPYGDPWDVETVIRYADMLAETGIPVISLADTIGCATPDSIAYLFSGLISKFPRIEFGAHLHTVRDSWKEKIDAAYQNGCLRFDGAIKGYGGCPMAADELTGNMPTELLLEYFRNNVSIEPALMAEIMREADDVFSVH
jgi:hydroxymethylglutaryl-CoA lyase